MGSKLNIVFLMFNFIWFTINLWPTSTGKFSRVNDEFFKLAISASIKLDSWLMSSGDSFLNMNSIGLQSLIDDGW